MPLGIISFILAERYLPHTTHVHRPFDVLSAIMSGITFGLLIFGIDGIAHGHSSGADRWRELGRRVVLGTLFVWRQTRLADPMMPIDVFRRPIFALSITPATCTFTAQGLAFVSLPFFFHTVLGKQRHRHRHPADRLAAGAGRHRADRRTAGRPPSRRRCWARSASPA